MADKTIGGDRFSRILQLAQQHSLDEDGLAECESVIRKIEKDLNLLEFKYTRALRDKHILSSLLTKTSEDLKQSLDLEKKFIAIMSHEIRTPLNSIIGFLDLIRSTELTVEQGRFLRNAHLSANHLMSLISDILDLSKIEAAQLEMHEEQVVLEDLLLDSLSMVASRVKKEVELVRNIVELDYLVIGDPVRIKQVFVNLLGNAIKFTHSGYIKLSIISTEDFGSDRVRIDFCVEDTGIGIPADRIDSVFESFRQGHSSSYGGTGLGLYLSRSIARMMGGDITVESTEGRGSCFFVHLVLKKGARKEHMFHFRQKSIVVAGDRTMARDGILTYFREQGAIIHEIDVKNSADVIGFCTTSGPVNVLIANLDKLGDTALSLATLLKDAYPSMTVIGITSDKDQADIGKFDAILVKPLTYYKLARKINSLLVRTQESQGASRFQDMKVLVAEDVEVNIILAENMFDMYFGIHVDIARDGVEALEKATSKPYDLIFMDIQMPEMDGIEATKAIRERGITIPIAAMTADAFSDSVDRAFAAGMNDYITKPIRKEHLLKILEKVAHRDATG
jgi:two-component system, sensor histidine kinase and response regulator